MEITEVRVFTVGEEKLKAYASIVIDGCFIINDLKIIQGRNGLFISMPSRRRKRGGYRDVAHPLNNETRGMIEDRVIGEYERSLREQGAQEPVAPREASGAVPVVAEERADAPEVPAPEAPAATSVEPVAESAPAEASSSTDGKRPPLIEEEESPVPAAAPSPGAGQPAIAAAGDDVGAPSPGGEEGDQTLEEVERLHLRDSFWSVS